MLFVIVSSRDLQRDMLHSYLLICCRISIFFSVVFVSSGLDESGLHLLQVLSLLLCRLCPGLLEMMIIMRIHARAPGADKVDTDELFLVCLVVRCLPTRDCKPKPLALPDDVLPERGALCACAPANCCLASGGRNISLGAAHGIASPCAPVFAQCLVVRLCEIGSMRADTATPGDKSSALAAAAAATQA